MGYQMTRERSSEGEELRVDEDRVENEKLRSEVDLKSECKIKASLLGDVVG